MESTLTAIHKEVIALHKAVRGEDWQEAYELAESIEASLATLRDKINEKQAGQKS